MCLVTGNIGINCEKRFGHFASYSIEPVSETTGTLTIDVCDENTYYASEAPPCGGRHCHSLSSRQTGAVVAQGETGGDGRFSFVVPEGYYAVSVTAPSHESYQNNYLVDPGVETGVKTVNLSLDAVKSGLRAVEETEVEDEYEMSALSTTKQMCLFLLLRFQCLRLCRQKILCRRVACV